MLGESEMSNSFQALANESRSYTPLQPKVLFERLCALEKVREWLKMGYIDKQDTYFVIGYRTLLNAKLVRQDQHSSKNTDGERIYAIRYLKIGFKFLKDADSAFLIRTPAGSGSTRLGEKLWPRTKSSRQTSRTWTTEETALSRNLPPRMARRYLLTYHPKRKMASQNTYRHFVKGEGDYLEVPASMYHLPAESLMGRDGLSPDGP
jgi:hypothetical protein